MNAILTIAIIIFSLSYFFLAGPYWNITPDSCLYFMAGKSLYKTGQYQVGGEALTVAPFVFPAMLAAIFCIFGESFFIINIFMKILVLLYIFLAFFLLKQKGLPNRWAIFFTLLTASSIHLFYESTRILGDVSFAFFSFIAIALFSLYIQRRNNYILSLAIIFMLISYFTKTIGIVLICASLVYFFFHNKKIFLLIFFCFLIPAVVWELRSLILHGRTFHYLRSFIEKTPWIPEYATPLEILKRTIVNYVPFKLKPLIAVFANHRSSNTFYAPFAIMVYLGVIIDIVKNKSFLGIYLFFYLFIYSVMNMYGGGTRYLIPILPFIFFYSFFFLKEVFLSINIKIDKNIFFQVLAIFFLLFYINKAYAEIKHQIYENHHSLFPGTLIKYKNNPDEQEISLWLKANTDKSIVCLSERHEIDGLISERKFYVFPYTENQKEMLDYIQTKNINYILVDKKSLQIKHFLLPIIINNKNLFELTIEKQHASLYKVERNK